MSKKIFVLIAICIAFIVSVYLWMGMPSAEEKISHKATLCNVIAQQDSPQSEADLLDNMLFTFENSTPRHAYNRPKFNHKYAKSLVHIFSKLSHEQQLEAKNNHQKCIRLIDQP